MSCYEVYVMTRMKKPYEELKIQRHFLTSIIEYRFIGILTHEQLKSIGIREFEAYTQITDKNILQKIGRILGIDLSNKSIVIKKAPHCK